MKHINDVNLFVFKDWFESFEEVLIDYDDFPASEECIQCWKLLKQHDKKIRFISHDSSRSFQEWKTKLEISNISVDLEQLINPARVIIDHLKSTNFNSKLFIVGTTALKNEFTKSGFQIADGGPNVIKEELKYLALEVKSDKEVGALIYDLDYNVNMQRFNRMWVYMCNPTVSLLTGISEETLDGNELQTIGPKIFLNKLTSLKGRDFEDFRKDSMNFYNYLLKTSNSRTPSKILMISKRFSVLESPFEALIVGKKEVSDEESVSNSKKFNVNRLNDFCTRIESIKSKM